MGGGTTVKGFGKLSREEKEGVIEYLSEFSLYEEVMIDGQTYILSHIGLPDGATTDNLDSFDAYDFVGPDINTDYGKEYFKDIILVTGHIPTIVIDKAHCGRVYRKHGHIAIDTGAAFGYGMGCVCLDTGEEFYIR
jgi:serine/threonine protein phosphatase 1